MFPQRFQDTILDSIVAVVHVAFGFLVVGRVLHSRPARALSRYPIVGPARDSLAAAFSEVGYDPAGQP